MEKVTGIGGVFFRANDPAALSAWYRYHLGIDPVSEHGAWSQAPGPTVFAPFARNTTYLGDPEQQFMLNFRVADLGAMMAQLDAAGITVETREEWDSPEIGRFARIHDPEGNPIELWEPAPGAIPS
ncbi:VOC family protein [Histidinibacterium aquaticum]|uniref:VOC family protein n=1 Tax=Histidinibacterium aquaticum TaxID=2613962 RepID=A0A5J5GN63_9RHOB|nr:VOC family protein [Histidinibacterium aquaticum]KAA9009816.1 VOC family protein [Histidinibacterium aquaticum]